MDNIISNSYNISKLLKGGFNRIKRETNGTESISEYDLLLDKIDNTRNIINEIKK